MWKHGCIGDVLVRIQNGVNCKQDKNGAGDKITRIETIANGQINYQKTGFAELDERQKNRAKLNIGDILFSHINSPIHVGRTAICESDEPLFHGINLLRLVTNNDVDSRYFYFFLVSLYQSGYWKRVAKQSVNQASVNQTDIKSVPFSYPPLAEQKRIVESLDKAFAEIDKAIATAEAKEGEIKSLSSSLLTSVLNTYLGQAEIIALKNVCHFFGDGDWIETKDQAPEGLRLIQTGNIKVGFFADRKKNARYIDEETFKRLRCTEIFAGDLLVSRLPDPVGRACLIPELGERAITAVDCTIIRLKRDLVDAEYLNYYLQSKQYFEDVQKVVTGATRQRISRKNLGQIPIIVPPLETQREIARGLNRISEKIEMLDAVNSQSQAAYPKLKAAILKQELTPSEAV